MSDMVFNICLFRWTTSDGVWRFRVGLYKKDAVQTWRWQLGRLAATWFSVPR